LKPWCILSSESLTEKRAEMARKSSKPSRRKDTPSTKQGFKEVRLHWGSDKDLSTLHVNHVIINHSGDEFYVTFGELYPPLFTDPEDIPDDVEIHPKVT
jgi:hypothetical protein